MGCWPGERPDNAVVLTTNPVPNRSNFTVAAHASSANSLELHSHTCCHGLFAGCIDHVSQVVCQCRCANSNPAKRHNDAVDADLHLQSRQHVSARSSRL